MGSGAVYSYGIGVRRVCREATCGADLLTHSMGEDVFYKGLDQVHRIREKAPVECNLWANGAQV